METTTVIILVAMGVLIVLAIFLYRANQRVKPELEMTLKQDNSSGAGGAASGNANQSQTGGAAALPMQGERPEIIAAAMGALFFTLEEGASRPFAITSVTRSAASGGMQDNWALAGRNRLMQVRQDFALNKGRKAR